MYQHRRFTKPIKVLCIENYAGIFKHMRPYSCIIDTWDIKAPLSTFAIIYKGEEKCCRNGAHISLPLLLPTRTDRAAWVNLNNFDEYFIELEE